MLVALSLYYNSACLVIVPKVHKHNACLLPVLRGDVSFCDDTKEMYCYKELVLTVVESFIQYVVLVSLSLF